MVAFPEMVDSAAVEHVAATVLAVEEFGVKVTSNSPPDVHLRRTLLVLGLDPRGNDHRGVLENRRPGDEEKEADWLSSKTVKQKTVPFNTQRDTKKSAGEGRVDERYQSPSPNALSSFVATTAKATACIPPHLRADDTISPYSPRYEHLRAHTPHDIEENRQNTMPAPTAPLKPVVDDAPPTNVALPGTDDDQEFALDGMNDLPESSAIQAPLTAEDMEIVDEEDRPRFPQVQNDDGSFRIQSRKIPVPPHRFSPLKSNWPQIYPPLVEHLKLAVRMNVKQKAVELRNSKTSSPGALQKGEDFIRAFCLGFDVGDAIALLRLDDLAKQNLQSSKTRVILADSKVHILGAFKNIQIARSSIVNLIRGKPPGKVYNNLRAVSARMKERF
ncbi:hypothetical protein CHU98_g3346 [Xylaria longipes]|nr:hypothetical protein CHU98_g3346 [Xylaria longipes]